MVSTPARPMVSMPERVAPPSGAPPLPLVPGLPLVSLPVPVMPVPVLVLVLAPVRVQVPAASAPLLGLAVVPTPVLTPLSLAAPPPRAPLPPPTCQRLVWVLRPLPVLQLAVLVPVSAPGWVPTLMPALVLLLHPTPLLLPEQPLRSLPVPAPQGSALIRTTPPHWKGQPP